MDDVDGLKDTTSFTIEGSKTVTAYWTPKEYLSNTLGSPWYVGFATDDEIYLNKSYADRIDNAVIAHEYGHCIGFDHVEDTLMDPTIGGFADSDRDVPLSDVTREVFEALDAVELCDWSESGMDDLQSIGREYALNNTDMETLNYAARRWVLGSDIDGYWLGSWNGFGGYSGVTDENLQDGSFY